MKTIPQTIIRFPEIKLQTRDGHKLRGYFGQLFKGSVLFHNHTSDGKQKYQYPPIQYKVIDHVPLLVGMGEGAAALTAAFLKINEIDIDGKKYPVYQKNLEQRNCNTGHFNQLHTYQFKTHWMPLSSDNYIKFNKLKSPEEKSKFLEAILTGNLLSFFKDMGIWLKKDKETILLKGKFKQTFTNFKGNKMLSFTGAFTCNCLLPDFIGIGRSVSRGFGTIIKE